MSEKYSTHSRREENVEMRSELRMIGGSSAIFKSSLLVLFGPYTKRLLCKFKNTTIQNNIRRSQGWSPVYCISLTSDTKKKIIIMLHIVFLLALFSLFLDASRIHCIMVLLHSLIYQASVLSVVECLLYATLEAHYIFLLTIILPFRLHGWMFKMYVLGLHAYIQAAWQWVQTKTISSTN